jgi:Uma2 family endonuclease
VIEQDGYIHSAPELLVEMLSPASPRSERAEKLLDYESLGVPEVWVVSPEAQTVEILLLQDGRLATTSLLRQGELKPTRFPEAAIDISAIWPK